MAADNPGERSRAPRRTFGQRAKQAGLFMLFAAILVIPRLRRLRRRVWVWSAIRLSTAAAATILVWRYRHAGAGIPSLVCGLLLFGFALLIRAKPLAESDDAWADELGALIVLNGGTFRPTPDSPAIPHARILVRPDLLTVTAPGERCLLQIPLTKVKNLVAHAVIDGTVNTTQGWEVEIDWVDDEPCTTTFQYEGFFAEHLARVAESTLRSQWKKELPILSH